MTNTVALVVATQPHVGNASLGPALFQLIGLIIILIFLLAGLRVPKSPLQEYKEKKAWEEKQAKRRAAARAKALEINSRYTRK